MPPRSHTIEIVTMIRLEDLRSWEFETDPADSRVALHATMLCRMLGNTHCQLPMTSR
jgi:hypothetical protein